MFFPDMLPPVMAWETGVPDSMDHGATRPDAIAPSDQMNDAAECPASAATQMRAGGDSRPRPRNRLVSQYATRFGGIELF